MLILARKLNESIIVGDNVEIIIVDFKGDQVKLGIRAPKDVKVYRGEIYDAIQKENIEAAKIANVPNAISQLMKSKKKS
jgi:carbon storage regulator